LEPGQEDILDRHRHDLLLGHLDEECPGCSVVLGGVIPVHRARVDLPPPAEAGLEHHQVPVMVDDVVDVDVALLLVVEEVDGHRARALVHVAHDAPRVVLGLGGVPHGENQLRPVDVIVEEGPVARQKTEQGHRADRVLRDSTALVILRRVLTATFRKCQPLGRQLVSRVHTGCHVDVSTCDCEVIRYASHCLSFRRG
jgi:hypothetical protein